MAPTALFPRPFAGLLRLLLSAALCATPASAFNPPKDSAGPLTVEIADPGEVTSLETPVEASVTLTNSGDTALAGSVEMSVADEWRIEGEATRAFSLAAKASRTIPFRVVAGKGTHAALYPVHARAVFAESGGASTNAHAILIVNVAREAVAVEATPWTARPALRLPRRGALRLDSPAPYQASIAVRDKPAVVKPSGWRGLDEETGASVQFTETDRGGRRAAIGVHPPYRGASGEVRIDWRLALPAGVPVFFETAAAIRDHDPEREPPSDGVEFKVQVSVGGGEFQTLFERFSAAKEWSPVRVDLTPFAGSEATLRLVAGPGPAGNTTCDSAFWADPILRCGDPAAGESPDRREARKAQALAAARAAAQGEAPDWAWKLESEAAAAGAALVPGPNGIVDAFLAFAEGDRALAFEGFTVEIDGLPVAAGPAGRICEKVERRVEDGRASLVHEILKDDRPLRVEARVWAEKGALRIAFAMPGARRDERGEPRFTALAVGAASEKARRVYAGFGNVIEDPGAFELRAGGFTLSTRHTGMDFANGLSLVQASSLFPDLLRVDPERSLYALVASHDTTLSFLPSTRGAFAAARAYRGLAGFEPAAGVAKLQGRMCLDQWGGDYRKAAEDLEKAGRYGLGGSVFVKHDWQRWGYDYRLPEIYPPRGSFEDFRAMVDAAKRHDILFCPHDNYIDFYPDAEGFSYEHVLFNRDGTPQKAWFNEGRKAQSYRWLPTAFLPWLENNLRLVKTGFAPTSYFVDVFTAIPPIDFYDRRGRFFPKTVTQERWGAAFDRIREILGDDAPTLSEAGTDALVGHLDGAQSDHGPWLPALESESRNAHFRWRMPAGDGERVPWHDMASHGSFVLLAGGLGPRYAGGDDSFLHGYASDDYLSLTVLGGRNPMCDGPFSRRAVMTHWLLHGLCAELARGDFLAHEFAGDDIHRQIVRFSNGSAAVNRGATDWQVEGHTLPSYGFVAKAGPITASIARRDGLITAFATGPGHLFADARPPALDSPSARAQVKGVDDLGNGSFRVRLDWEVLRALPPGARPFLHFDTAAGEGEEIAFQGGLKLDAAKLGDPGLHPSEAVVALGPEQAKEGAQYLVRYGLYVPGEGGTRVALDAPSDPGMRAKGGRILVETGPDRQPRIRWEPEPADANRAARNERINLAGRIVDFGPVATNGAFRLRETGDGWEMTPLPDSRPFVAGLDPAKLGAPGRTIQSIRAIDHDGGALEDPQPRQEGARTVFDVDGKAFGYRIRLSP